VERILSGRQRQVGVSRFMSDRPLQEVRVSRITVLLLIEGKIR
jgi:hypothetical protein